VSWLYFFLVICDDTLTYNQEENKAMTPSHITWKKKAMKHSLITRKKIKINEGVMALFFLGYM
jgi:hypothetical protein